MYLVPCNHTLLTTLPLTGFHGYGYFQTAAAAAAAAQNSTNSAAAAQAAAAQANGILQQSNAERQANGSSYYEYQMSSNGHRTEAARGDYARNGEIVAAATGQISTQLTTGTSTPALVAQALSGNY